MCHLVKLALVCSTLPERLIKNFDIDLGPNILELDLVNQIRKNAAKVPDLDPTILSGLDLPSSEVTAHLNYQYDNNNATHPNRTSSSFKCYNCGKVGHSKNDCRVKYCSIHQTASHKYADCFARKKKHKTPYKSSGNNKSFSSK